MTRKVYVQVTVRLIIDMEEGVEVGDVIQEMDYNFTSTIDNTKVVDSEITEHEVVDVK